MMLISELEECNKSEVKKIAETFKGEYHWQVKIFQLSPFPIAERI